MTCSTWKLNRGVNPLTNRKIKKSSPIYKRLENFCESDKVCKDFSSDPSKNPLSNRKLKDNSNIAKFLLEMCNNETKEAKNKSKSGKKTVNENNYNYTASTLQCTEYEKVTLKEHQSRVCNFLQDHKTKGMLLFHSVGSGKTLTSITMIRCILKKTPGKKVYVLTPTSLVANFKKEMVKHGVNFEDNVKIYSYGVFLNKIKKDKTFAQNSVLLIDEAHNFKTVVRGTNGGNVKLLMKATRLASQVFLLTATPVQNSMVEITNLYAMISKKEDDIPGLYKLMEEASNSKLLSMFKNKVSYFKNNDTSDYPAVTYHDLKFEMTRNYYDLYKQVERNEWDLFGGQNLSVFYNGVRRAVNFIDKSVTTPKIEWTIKHIKHCVQHNRKVLIYSNWLASGLKIIQERLDSEDINWVEVNGALTPNNRTRSVNKYNRNETFVLFVSSAGAEGLDLKGTRSVILLEPHWNNEKIKQIIGRAVRYKSHDHLDKAEQHVDIYHLILQKPKGHKDNLESADDYLIKLSQNKEQLINHFYDVLIESAI